MNIVVKQGASQVFYLPSVSCSRNHLLSAPLIVFSSSLWCVHSIQILVMAPSLVFLLLLPLLAKGSQRLPDKMLGMYVNLADNGLPGQEVLFSKGLQHMLTVHSSGTMMKVTGVLFFIRINRLEQTFCTSPLSIQQPCWCLSLSGSLVINDRKTCNIKSTAILQQ